MKCMVIVLNKEEKLDDLLACFGAKGLRGATILDSEGMGHRLLVDIGDEVTSIVYSLRNVVNSGRSSNKTILMVLKDEEVVIAKEVIENILGDMSKPDTGICFTMPVDFVLGGCFGND